MTTLQTRQVGEPAPERLARCRQKTATGNWYRSYKRAKSAASWSARRIGAPMRAYRCPCCSYYHVGSRRKRPEVVLADSA